MKAVWPGPARSQPTCSRFRPLFRDLAPALTPDGQWNRAPIDAANLDFGDLDLRLSASRARLADALENAGFSIMLTNGKLEVTLADAKAYGGTLKGRADIAHGVAGLDLRLAANFSDVDSAAFLSDVLQARMFRAMRTGTSRSKDTGQPRRDHAFS